MAPAIKEIANIGTPNLLPRLLPNEPKRDVISRYAAAQWPAAYHARRRGAVGLDGG
jgi:hypothetical protein